MADSRSGDPGPVDLPRRYNAASHFVDRHLAEGRGDKIAFIDDQGRHSYADLARRVNQAGNLLKAQGVRMEQRVMLCLLDGIDFPALFFGAIKLGAVPIPVNTLLTTADYDFLLRDSRAVVLVVSAPLLEKFRPIISGQPYLEKILVSGTPPAGSESLGALLAKAGDRLEAAATTPDDVAFWLYSSGSTGMPKGAMHLQSDLVNTAVLYGDTVLGVGENDLVFSAAKLFFAYGLGNAMTFPLHAGATAVLMAERPTPESVMRTLRTHNPNIFYGVPTLYGAILADPALDRSKGSNRLRICVSAGEALPEDLARRWRERFGVDILDGIGSTEMLHIFLSNRRDDVRYGTTGKAVPGYGLKIVDEDGHEVPDGEIGELLVQGPSSAIAYWNNRAKSLATFQGPWTRTGDKYQRDAEGYYHYAGRSDDMLKVGGIWVSPFEVESALLAHEKVLEAAVVGQEDGDRLVKPKAYVVLRAGGGSSELADELKGFVKDRLAPYKYPRWIEFVDSLPKTATGKIQRFKLRAPTAK
jgi:4-hydroxybenzoate-CoA ligase/benzoate-CoA ligase